MIKLPCIQADIPDNACIMEGMTSISATIEGIISGICARKIIAVIHEHNMEKNQKKAARLSFLRIKSQELGFELVSASREEIDSIATGSTHGGVIAVCTEREIPELSEDMISSSGFFIAFDGIEDPYNLGYCIRSAFAAGASGIILPHNERFGSSTTIARSSAGTSEKILIAKTSTANAADIFLSKKYNVICADIRDSVSVYDANLSLPLFVIIGGEKRGISRDILSRANANVRIDYAVDFKGSLPSASATAIIAFEVARQNGLLTK